MEKLFRRLQHNNVTMIVYPLERPDQLRIKFSKIINGEELSHEFFMDVLTIEDGSYHARMLNERLDIFLRYYCKLMKGELYLWKTS